MKKFFKTISIVSLCLALGLCLHSCVQKGSESTSQKHYYSYTDIQPPPKIPTFEFETFDLGIWEKEREKEKTYMITYSALLSCNNNVGNSWGYGLKYGGEYIESGCYVACNGISRGIYVTAYAIEYDNYNDYGSTYVSFDSLNVGEKRSKEVAVTVRENRGRYSGNTAQWVFQITVERIS